MSATADPLVVVCRDPRDHARARVRLSKLHAFDFDAFSDGSRSRFSRAMLVAYIDPMDIVDGAIHRPASHGPAPVRIKVAIPRTQNQVVYPIIERMAAANRIAQLAPVPRQRVRLDAPAIPKLIRAPVALPPPAASAVPVAPVVPTAPRPPRARRAPVARPRVENAPAICSRAIDVAAIRARTKLSPDAFADRLGVSSATVYAWEAGRRSPRARREAALLAMAEDCTRVQSF